MRTCPRCGQENPDGVRFCGACGAEVAPTRPPEVRKTVTIVFADLAGSTAMGEALDPEAMRRKMSRYFEELRSALERHGGTVEKFIGDAVMAVFGLPHLHEDDALRAVRATAELREAVRKLGLRVRVGVNTGEVVAGEGETLVTGDAVNVAARLEQIAEAEEILIGQGTYRLVREAVRCEAVEPLELKGKAQRVSAFRLLEVLPDVPAFTRQLDAPFVGRGRELETLRSVLARAVEERMCQLATIVGAPGIGKSRLARELIQGADAQVLVGRCLPYGEGITFWPLVEIVKQLPRPAAELVATDENSELIANRITAAVGAGEVGAAAEEISWAFRRLFEALARERPLIVALDDIHWAEPTLLDLLEYLVTFTSEVPILLLCLARPDLFDARPSWSNPRPNATLITLEALSTDDSTILVERLVRERELPEAARAKVVEAAEGNPLFVEQLLAMHAESGNGELLIPPTIQALLAARIDRLEPEERAVVERASVEGRMFHRGTVGELLPEPARRRVGTHLMTLVRKEFIRPDRALIPGDDGFRFAHILIRDAAYDSMPKQLRAELHERFATWLEARLQAGAREYEEILGYHLEQAYGYLEELDSIDAPARELAERAAAKLAGAGRRALARGDMPAAANLLERAASLLSDDDPRRLELLLDVVGALTETGDFQKADALLTAGLVAPAAQQDRRLQARASVERYLMRVFTDRPIEEARRAAEDAIPIFEEAGDERGLARAYRLLAHAHWFGAVPAFAASEEMLERALVHARHTGDEREEAVVLRFLAGSALWGPMPVPEALRRCEDILEHVKGRRREVEAGCLMRIAGLKAMEGLFDEARELVVNARAIMEDVGLVYLMAHSTDVVAMIEMLADNPEAAEQELRSSYAALEQMGEHGFVVEQAWLLAGALYAQGRYSEAEHFLAIWEEAGTQEEWGTTRAKLLAQHRRFEEAEEVARGVVARWSRTDTPNQRGHGLMDLAEVLQLARRADEAVPIVEEAVRMFEAKGNEVLADKARTLLKELHARVP